ITRPIPPQIRRGVEETVSPPSKAARGRIRQKYGIPAAAPDRVLLDQASGPTVDLETGLAAEDAVVGYRHIRTGGGIAGFDAGTGGGPLVIDKILDDLNVAGAAALITDEDVAFGGVPAPGANRPVVERDIVSDIDPTQGGITRAAVAVHAIGEIVEEHILLDLLRIGTRALHVDTVIQIGMIGGSVVVHDRTIDLGTAGRPV